MVSWIALIVTAIIGVATLAVVVTADGGKHLYIRRAAAFSVAAWVVVVSLGTQMFPVVWPRERNLLLAAIIAGVFAVLVLADLIFRYAKGVDDWRSRRAAKKLKKREPGGYEEEVPRADNIGVLGDMAREQQGGA